MEKKRERERARERAGERERENKKQNTNFSVVCNGVLRANCVALKKTNRRKTKNKKRNMPYNFDILPRTTLLSDLELYEQLIYKYASKCEHVLIFMATFIISRIPHCE